MSLYRLVAIMGFTAFFLDLFFLEETYPPVILIDKAAELRRRTKNWGIHAKQEEIEVDFRELVTKNFSRPLRILFTERKVANPYCAGIYTDVSSNRTCAFNLYGLYIRSSLPFLDR